MKWFRTCVYFFRRATDNVFENPLLNAITIGIIAVTLFLFSSFLLFLSDLNTLFEVWGKGIRVVGYLDQDLQFSKQEMLEKKIKQRKDVESIIFVSKNEALIRIQRILKGNSKIIKDLKEDNPLPESFEISLHKEFRDQETMGAFAGWLGKQKGIDQVVYGQEWVERFTTTLNVLRWIGTVLGGIMILAAVFIISNTIKITLYARRDELEIMQLVGATNFFIKIPFILEGSFQGLLGAGAAVGILYLFNYALMERISQVYTIPDFPFLSIPVMGVILFGGMMLGAGGSLISMGRFLKN